MKRPVIVAVDPGGRYSGVVVRQGDALHAHTIVERDGDEAIASYVYRVVGAIGELIVELPGAYNVIACEDIKPMPHLRSSPMGAFITCKVIGAIMLEWGDVLMVPPGARHGLRPLLDYPADLVGPHEVVGGGKLQHCRSAWDVAGSAASIQLELAA